MKSYNMKHGTRVGEARKQSIHLVYSRDWSEVRRAALRADTMHLVAVGKTSADASWVRAGAWALAVTVPVVWAGHLLLQATHLL